MPYYDLSHIKGRCKEGQLKATQPNLPTVLNTIQSTQSRDLHVTKNFMQFQPTKLFGTCNNKWQDFKLVTTYPDDVNCQGGVIHWWEANCLGWIAWEKGPGETFSGSDGIWSSKEGVARDRKWRLVVISLQGWRPTALLLISPGYKNEGTLVCWKGSKKSWISKEPKVFLGKYRKWQPCRFW